MYIPLEHLAAGEVMAIVRVRGNVVDLAPALRRAVAAVSPGMAVWNVRTLADGHAYMTRVPRVLSGMAVAGGAAGLLVAAVGLYGLLAFRVRQRRREMGIRLSLGADGRRLAWEVMEVALRQLAPAVLIGLSLAWLASPVLRAFLLGADPRSGVVYAGVGVAFLGTGLLAALVPARAKARNIRRGCHVVGIGSLVDGGVQRRGSGGEGRMDMVPVRGRPLGPLGWLMLALLDVVVGDDMTPERGA